MDNSVDNFLISNVVFPTLTRHNGGMEVIEVNQCEEHGDPYVDCEGEVKHREFCGQTLCSSHMGAYIALMEVGRIA